MENIKIDAEAFSKILLEVITPERLCNTYVRSWSDHDFSLPKAVIINERFKKQKFDNKFMSIDVINYIVSVCLSQRLIPSSKILYCVTNIIAAHKEEIIEQIFTDKKYKIPSKFASLTIHVPLTHQKQQIASSNVKLFPGKHIDKLLQYLTLERSMEEYKNGLKEYENQRKLLTNMLIEDYKKLGMVATSTPATTIF